MAVQLLCPNLRCRKVLAVPEEVRGKLVTCQFCRQKFRVPEAQAHPCQNHRRLSAFHYAHFIRLYFPGMDAPPQILSPNPRLSAAAIGGALSIGATLVGVALFLFACVGFNAALSLAIVPVLLAVAAIVLTVVGALRDPEGIPDSQIVAALLTAFIGLLTGALELAVAGY